MSVSVPVIRRRTESTDLSLFPNLFYLGPQRTGSTWLHANLCRHPEIHLHRDKETFYFSTLGRPEAPRYRYEFLEDYLDSFREGIGRRLLKNYHTLRRCGSFYRPRVRGDFTASYGILDERVIAQVVRLQPDMCGIMLVRDPLERAWSHAKKDLTRGRERPVSAEELIEFMQSSDQIIRADYSSALASWRKYLAPGKMFVAPYSRISEQPEELLQEINGFLGIRKIGGASKRHVVTRQNVTSNDAVPDACLSAAKFALGSAIESYRKLLQEIGNGKVL